MNEWLEELIEQIKVHGTDTVRMYLEDSGEDGVDLELTIRNVQYQDGEVVVKLA